MDKKQRFAVIVMGDETAPDLASWALKRSFAVRLVDGICGALSTPVYGDTCALEAQCEGVFSRFAVNSAVKRLSQNREARPEARSGHGRRRWDSNPRGLFTLHDFQSCSLDHYETPPEGWAERVGFEPTRACTLPLFESGTFDHSDISPSCSIA